MAIGIIANPASGKDIRRLVSYATTVGNTEKVNIVKRIVMAAISMGEKKIYIMPDAFQIGYSVMASLEKENIDVSPIEVIEMPFSSTMFDTVHAAEHMEKAGVSCIVVMGGDGTSRACVKGLDKTPVIPVSTGTNNVYPRFAEGTVVGMAAAAADMLGDISDCCIKDKIITVSVDGEPKDIALIDATVSADDYAGARAIWKKERIMAIAATRCHPASIGFSAVPGALTVVKDTDKYGVYIEPDPEGVKVKASIASGKLEVMTLGEPEFVPLGESVDKEYGVNCMIALDGEREIKVKKGQTVTFNISQDGPFRIDLRKIIEKAQREGLFRVDS